MHFLKLLHFAALLIWCGTLLYLPALIAAGMEPARPTLYRDQSDVMRTVFTLVASPAALLAIASGTALILGAPSLDTWLLVKLSVVSFMVFGHAGYGVLILRIEEGSAQRIRFWCVAVGGTMALLIGTVLWLALAKPL